MLLLLNSIYQLWVLCMYKMSLFFWWWWQKKNSIKIFLHGEICVKVWRNHLRIHLDRVMGSWSMTSKAEFSNESPVLFLLSVQFTYIYNTPRYHILQENGTDIQKQDRSLTTKFCFWRHGPQDNRAVTSLPSLGQCETGSDFSKIKI